MGVREQEYEDNGWKHSYFKFDTDYWTYLNTSYHLLVISFQTGLSVPKLPLAYYNCSFMAYDYSSYSVYQLESSDSYSWACWRGLEE